MFCFITFRKKEIRKERRRRRKRKIKKKEKEKKMLKDKRIRIIRRIADFSQMLAM